MANRRPSGFSSGTKDIIWNRASGCCEQCGVGLIRGGGGHEFHHRQPRGMGGSRVEHVNKPSNGLLLCRGCHRWVESNRDRAREEGFLVPLNGSALPTDVMVRHHMWGPVLLGDDGSLSFVGGGVL